MDAARANGRGGGAAKEAFLDANATDPFIAHQLAKLGVDEAKYQGVRAAAGERRRRSTPPRRGRGGQLVGVMDGYGGEESFKGRRMGDFYDEDSRVLSAGARGRRAVARARRARAGAGARASGAPAETVRGGRP